MKSPKARDKLQKGSQRLFCACPNRCDCVMTGKFGKISFKRHLQRRHSPEACTDMIGIIQNTQYAVILIFILYTICRNNAIAFLHFVQIFEIHHTSFVNIQQNLYKVLTLNGRIRANLLNFLRMFIKRSFMQIMCFANYISLKHV